MGGICGGGDGEDNNPAVVQGPLAFELNEGVDSAGVRGRKFGVTASVTMPKYVVVSMKLMGLEALWSIALEVRREVCRGRRDGGGVGLAACCDTRDCEFCVLFSIDELESCHLQTAWLSSLIYV